VRLLFVAPHRQQRCCVTRLLFTTPLDIEHGTGNWNIDTDIDIDIRVMS
jgi:hypothetical protein